MSRRFLSTLSVLAFGAGCSHDSAPSPPSGPVMSFFVTSVTSVTGNLGGLAAADGTCQRLAAAVNAGNRTWRAYLSVERDSTNRGAARRRRAFLLLRAVTRSGCDQRKNSIRISSSSIPSITTCRLNRPHSANPSAR